MGGVKGQFCVDTNSGTNNSTPATIKPLLEFPIINYAYPFEVSALPTTSLPIFVQIENSLAKFDTQFLKEISIHLKLYFVKVP